MKIDLCKTNGSSPPCISSVHVVSQAAGTLPNPRETVTVALEDPAIRGAIQRGARKAQVKKYAAVTKNGRDGVCEHTSDFVQATCVALLENHRKIHGARDKIFIIREMVQNAWDEDITRVDILLTPPDENGHSIIRVTDDSPHGWFTLEHAYTMYAESTKANDPTKRGRFNEGEKNVLCLAIEASVTTVTGQVCFDRERGRWNGSEHRKRGSEFYMKFELTPKEYAGICRKTRLLIPPKDVITTFNGVEIAHRAPDSRFEARLRTPRDGRNEPRKTEVRLYNVLPGEQPMIYEMGIPVVELSDDKWHVNVMQKMPVGRDRDNVNPSYIGDVRVAIFNEFYTKLSPSDASLLSTQAAASHPKSLTEAVKANLAARFGDKYALEDPTDPGSKEEFVSQGGTVIQRNDLSPEMKRRLRKIKDEKNPRKSFVKRTGEVDARQTSIVEAGQGR